MGTRLDRSQDPPGTKTCSKCRETKPHNFFYSHKGHLDGLTSECVPCRTSLQVVSNRRPEAKRKHRNALLKREYGIDLDKHAEMLVSQGRKCAICAREFPSEKETHVDHDHLTGRVRGLLCSTCNQAIGMFRDDPELCVAAAIYLQNHTTKSLATYS